MTLPAHVLPRDSPHWAVGIPPARPTMMNRIILTTDEAAGQEVPREIVTFARQVATVTIDSELSLDERRRRESVEHRWMSRTGIAIGATTLLACVAGAAQMFIDGDVGIAVVTLFGSVLLAVPVGVLGAMLIGPLVVLLRHLTWPEPEPLEFLREHEIVHDRSSGYSQYAVYVKDLAGGVKVFYRPSRAMSAQESAALREKARTQLRDRPGEPWL